MLCTLSCCATMVWIEEILLHTKHLPGRYGHGIPHHGPALWTTNDGAPCIPPIKTCLSHNPPTLQDFNPGVPFTLCSTHATSLSTFGEYLVSQFDV